MSILEYAIHMENNGEAYYSEQAKLNKYNSIGVVSSLLAEAENSHMRLLREKAVELDCILPERAAILKAENVFRNLGRISNNGRVVPTQFDFYRKAIELEQQSIDFYQGLLETAADKEERSLLEFLVEQEKCHIALLDDLADMLRHSVEWSESAAFSLCKEAY